MGKRENQRRNKMKKHAEVMTTKKAKKETQRRITRITEGRALIGEGGGLPAGAEGYEMLFQPTTREFHFGGRKSPVLSRQGKNHGEGSQVRRNDRKTKS